MGLLVNIKTESGNSVEKKSSAFNKVILIDFDSVYS